MVALTILLCDSGLFVVQLARTAATWRATDPAPINEFIRRHVPPGSAVVGPEAPYFFPVERNGSRYPHDRGAQLGRLGALGADRRARRRAPRVAVRRAGRRSPAFSSGRPTIRCRTTTGAPRDHLVDRFEPPANYLHLLGRLGHPLDRGYPATSLYRLADGCPTGYDPTVGH